jgi:hypothetical protein
MSLSSLCSAAASARRAWHLRRAAARRWRSHTTIALVAVLAVACGGDSTAPSALAITPDAPVVRVGRAMQLRVTGADGPITWTTSDAGIASVAAGLVAGVAAGTATITAAVGTRSTDVQLTVTRAPTIVLAANTITFASTEHGATPDAQTVAITNGGDESVDGLAVGTITYTGGASDWLSAAVSAETAPAELTLQPTTAALDAGTYTATVPITSTTGVNAPRTVVGTYVIGPTPVIKLGQPIVNFTAQATGTAATPQSVTITNVGGGTLSGLAAGTITYSNGASGWLTANINPSTAPAALTMQPSTTGLAVGTYTATVPVTSTVPGVTAANVSVTYQVTSAPVPPAIALGASSADFEATAGGALPAAQATGVANAGGGTLDGLTVAITYSGAESGWLSATLGASTAPTDLTMQPTSVLSAGTYTADVAISSSDVATTNSPQHIAVTYTVSAPPAIDLSATSATFSATAPSVDPAQQTVDVSNSGGGSLSGLSANIAYSETTTGWLTATVASSAPDAPSTTPLTLHVTTGSIAPGEYHATVTVSSSVAGVASQTVAVTFTRIATLTGDVQPIFTSSCALSGCHVGVTSPLGVDLSNATTSYASLVGVPAATGTGERVVAGDSTNSYLRKQVSQDPSALAMPAGCSGSTCLSPDLVHLISMWIQQGANQ